MKFYWKLFQIFSSAMVISSLHLILILFSMDFLCAISLSCCSNSSEMPLSIFLIMLSLNLSSLLWRKMWLLRVFLHLFFRILLMKGWFLRSSDNQTQLFPCPIFYPIFNTLSFWRFFRIYVSVIECVGLYFLFRPV